MSDIVLLVGKEIGKSSLLNKVIFFVQSDVLHLLFGVDKRHVLNFFNLISPLVTQLHDFISGVDVVENGELGSKHEREMTDFCVANVPAKEELVVEYETTHPLIMGPSTHARDWSDTSNINKQEDQTTAGATEWFIMRRNLLRSDSFEKMSHVFVMTVNQWVTHWVIRMNITLFHLWKFVRVITLLIHFVLRLGSANKKSCYWIWW